MVENWISLGAGGFPQELLSPLEVGVVVRKRSSLRAKDSGESLRSREWLSGYLEVSLLAGFYYVIEVWYPLRKNLR